MYQEFKNLCLMEKKYIFKDMILTFWYRYEILNVGKLITTVTGIFLPVYFTYLLI